MIVLKTLTSKSNTRAFSKMVSIALADIAQWIEYGPVNQRVASSIPSQGTCLGCGPDPQ